MYKFLLHLNMYSNLYEKDKLLKQEIMWEQDKTNNSLMQQPMTMKFLPHIKHHMSTMPQKFHFIWSPRSAVMQNKKFN